MQALSRGLMALLVVLMASVAVAQPKAAIEAPERSLPGDLVKLDGTPSEGATAFAWSVIPPKAKAHAIVVKDGKVCIFATRRPGIYYFILAVTDSSGAIDQYVHTLTNVEGDDEPDDPFNPPDPKPDPDKPDPKPDPDKPEPPDASWKSWAHKTAEKLVNQPAGGPRKNTATKLASALEAVATEVQGNSSITLPGARVLLSRKTYEAVTAEEVTAWKAFSQEMDKEVSKVVAAGQVPTTKEWAAIVYSIALGLKEVR